MAIFLNALGLLSEALVKISNDKDKLRQIPKEDLRKLIINNIEECKNVSDQMSGFNDREFTNWVHEKALPIIKEDQNVATAWSVYRKNLKGSSVGMEQSRPLSALQEATKSYIKVLSDIEKELDSLYTENQIDLYDLRISHVAVLGVIKQSSKVADFATYLFTWLVMAVAQNSKNIPRYRTQFLFEHAAEVGHIVSDINDHRGDYNFLQQIDKVRRSSADIILGATGKFDFTDVARIGFYPPSIIENILSALSHLNIFRAAMNLWDDYRLTRYERNKETLEWLKTHTALLRLEIMNKDKDTKEYEKLMHIIEAYDAKITEYDRKIAEFEQEQ